MTCTSERSGMASSGVLITDQIPAMMMKRVASRTRKRFLADQSIRALSMGAFLWALPFVAGGG
jgi:hypothetical protein